MKRMISLLLILGVLLSLLPVSAFAESKTYIEVTKNNAPLRDRPYEEGQAIAKCEEGTVFSVVDTRINKRLNKWYEVFYNGKSCYIFSGNVKTHTHSYKSIIINDICFDVCACGDASVSSAPSDKKEVGNEILSSASLAAPAVFAGADGPLPIGDIIGLGILIVGTCYAHDILVPSTENLVEMLKESDFYEYLNESERVCKPTDFRLVMRLPGMLKYTDNRCMDVMEAYIATRFLHLDVYTADENAALALVAMHGSGIMERDKDKESFFYHYHLGTDRIIKSHIFFGLNDFGEGPV